jgi:putative transposase
MPRRARTLIGGYAYHVLNRANGRLRMFRKEADFAAFEQMLAEAQERVPLRILGYVVMGNHWHFVVWPRVGQGGDVSEFFRWLSVTHAQRWHAHHGTSGMGHLYQGRFKSFPIASDDHLLAVLRYVERNPLRAGLVARAEDWRWGSLYRRIKGTPEEQSLLSVSPIPLGPQWARHINQPQSEGEVAAIRESLQRGRPFGREAWQRKVSRQLGLEHTFRHRGRPRKNPKADSAKNDSRPL